MKIHYNLFVFILVNLVNTSCGPVSQNVEGNNSEVHSQSRKLTQALLLTQARRYTTEDKDMIKGKYILRDTLVVPPDLDPQNKWLMFEGPVLENDLIAYRYYADSRHRFDVYGKRVSDLVMDKVSWDYHNIMDWGSDILKVGNSLGLGSPAIYYKDSLYTLSNCVEKIIEITQDGDSRSSIRTTFKSLKIRDYSFDLVQDWSITAGNPAAEIHLKVKGGNLPSDMYFATGIVKHLPDINVINGKQHFYAMNWGKQSFHDENMGMALILSNEHEPNKVEDDLSHVFVFKNARTEVNYRFLAAWEKDISGVKNQQSFADLVMRSK